MKFCKDCSHCTASKPKTGTVVTVPDGADWMCDAPTFHVATGKKVSTEVQTCVSMRSGPCGPGAVLFTPKSK
jgi:hypothetical protein